MFDNCFYCSDARKKLESVQNEYKTVSKVLSKSVSYSYLCPSLINMMLSDIILLVGVPSK